MKNIQPNIIITFLMLLCAFTTYITGFTKDLQTTLWHIIFGFFFGIVSILHTITLFKRISVILKNFLQTKYEARLKIILSLVLLALSIFSVISGLFILLYRNAFFNDMTNFAMWRNIHHGSVKFLLVLCLTHVIVHWRWFKKHLNYKQIFILTEGLITAAYKLKQTFTNVKNITPKS